jgi:transcriptional regulator with XRE-family HTH domain
MRLERGITPTKVAARLHVSERTYRALELGSTSAQTVRRIAIDADVLGVSFAELTARRVSQDGTRPQHFTGNNRGQESAVIRADEEEAPV